MRGGHGPSFLALFQSFAGLFHLKQTAKEVGVRSAQRRAEPRSAAPAGIVQLCCAGRGGAKNGVDFENISPLLRPARWRRGACSERESADAARTLRGGAAPPLPPPYAALANHRLKTREGNLAVLNGLWGVPLTQICLH